MIVLLRGRSDEFLLLRSSLFPLRFLRFPQFKGILFFEVTRFLLLLEVAKGFRVQGPGIRVLGSGLRDSG